LSKNLAEVERRVLHGKTSPAGAARQVVDQLLSILKTDPK